MRAWLLILVMASTLASASLAVWYFNRSHSGEVGPPMDIARTPDRLPVLAGGDENLEILLRAFLPESGQDAFNRERIDQMLGQKRPDRDYLRLWIVNRSDRTLAFAPDSALRMVWSGHPEWQARSLAELVTEAEERGLLGTGDRFVLDGLARGDISELGPRAFVELIVVLPRNPAWTELDRIAMPALGGIELRRAEVAPDDLDRFLARPQGELLDRLVFPTSRPAELQASSK